ncbi:LPS export ABC transporter periplasmic protein LptC [Candidatus Bipolaricaulota bacterium]|nr:LPS export ABC transporter periplasmic protein LptC [Candidatus Bipolaricaulota bacterium]
MSRTAIVIVILVLIIGGVTLLLRRSAPMQEALTRAEQISVTGYREDGSPAWVIQAQAGSLDTNNSALESVELTLLRDPDAPIVVHGDRLSRDSGGSTLTGSIRVKQADTLSLETETLFWDEHNDVLESGPVDIEMESAVIEAGTFHHDLNTGLTTLSQGIEAQITHEGVEYTARSDSAESSSDQLALIGNVSIHTEIGDSYTCQRLESEPSASSVRLIGDVVGLWQESEFTADAVLLNDDGIRMHDNVIIDLDLLMMEGSHDS